VTILATLLEVSALHFKIDISYFDIINLRALNQVLPRPRAVAEPPVIPLDTFRGSIVPLPKACPRPEKEVLDDRPWPALTLPLFVPREPLPNTCCCRLRLFFLLFCFLCCRFSPPLHFQFSSLHCLLFLYGVTVRDTV
jgi:hypothetical protein